MNKSDAEFGKLRTDRAPARKQHIIYEFELKTDITQTLINDVHSLPLILLIYMGAFQCIEQ